MTGDIDSRHLVLDTLTGLVYARLAHGETAAIAHVEDAHECPAGLEREWDGLLESWELAGWLTADCPRRREALACSP